MVEVSGLIFIGIRAEVREFRAIHILHVFPAHTEERLAVTALHIAHHRRECPCHRRRLPLAQLVACPAEMLNKAVDHAANPTRHAPRQTGVFLGHRLKKRYPHPDIMHLVSQHLFYRVRIRKP